MENTLNKSTVAINLYKKIQEFFKMFFYNPFFIGMSLSFIVGKVVINLMLGARWVNALRSGLTGFVFYVLGCGLVHLLSTNVLHDPKKKCTTKLPSYFYWTMGWLLVSNVVLTLNVLGQKGILPFHFIIWEQLNNNWVNLVEHWMRNTLFIEGTGLIGWPYLIPYLLIPSIIMWKTKLPFPKILGLKTTLAALPFVAIYVISFLVIKDISIKNFLTLLFVIVWPALGEEFLYRGVIQRVLINITKKPVTGIVLTSFLFAAIHIPTYMINLTSGSLALTLSSCLSILFTSFFWGYGYYRTGVLWPWILIHALSDLVGF